MMRRPYGVKTILSTPGMQICSGLRLVFVHLVPLRFRFPMAGTRAIRIIFRRRVLDALGDKQRPDRRAATLTHHNYNLALAVWLRVKRRSRPSPFAVRRLDGRTVGFSH